MKPRQITGAVIIFLIPVVHAFADTEDSIYDAVNKGDLHRIGQLLQMNPRLVNTPSKSGHKPVHLAIYYREKRVAAFLVAHGAEIDIFVASGLGLKDRAAAFLKRDPSLAKAKIWDGLTPLHFAVMNNHQDVVKLLLDQKADVNAINNEEQYSREITPLSAAVANKDKAMVELLLAYQANVNLRFRNGQTVLHMARDKEMIRVLLAHKADPNAKTFTYSDTPLHYAVQYGTKAEVELLLNYGSDINAKGQSARTPLMIAALQDRKELGEFLLARGARLDFLSALTLSKTDAVTSFLKADPTLANQYLPNFGTSLHWVVERNLSKEIAQLLLAHGADVNAKKGISEDTPLHEAVGYGRRQITEVLLAHRADVNAQKANGTTPLLTAAMSGYPNSGASMMKLLLAHQADVNLSDHFGATPLYESAKKGDQAAVKLLLAHGANPDGKPSQAPKYADFKSSVIESPLYAAAEKGHLEIARLLVAAKASVHAKDRAGYTPLHRAAVSGSKAIAEVLLSHKADVNAKTEEDSTPLHSAVWQGHKEIVELLVARGADVNVQDVKGRTPLRIAIQQGKREIAEVLRRYGAKE